MLITKENFHLLTVSTRVIGKNFSDTYKEWNGIKGKIVEISYKRFEIAVCFDISAKGWSDSSLGVPSGGGRYFWINEDRDEDININLDILTLEYMLRVFKNKI